MTRSTELATIPKQPALAESERTIGPGELLVIDGNGRVLTRKLRRVLAIKQGVLAGLILALPLAAIGFTGIVGGLVGGAAVGTALVGLRWSFRPFVLAQSRLTAGDLDGAEALLARAPKVKRGIRAQMRATISAWIAYGRGRDEEAIAQFERALVVTGKNTIHYMLAQVGLADTLARSGQLERAKELRAQLKVPSPTSDLVEISVAGLDLTIAIAGHTERELDEDTLQNWTRVALELNNTSIVLAALAYVVAARGDGDLADHLAREARDRFCWCPLESWPLLQHWIDDRIAALPPVED